MSTRRIVVIGSANIDLVTRVPRSPKPGESLFGHSFMTVTGGKGANAALAAARLGAEVTFCGCVGDDDFGRQQRDSLSADGVDMTHLKVHPTEPTGTAMIMVADSGENSIVVTPGANAALTPEDIEALAPSIAEADALLLQLEIPLDTTMAALRMAREVGTLSIVDAGPAQTVSDEFLALCDVISPNETEANTLTYGAVTVDDVESAGQAAEILCSRGAATAIMKLGELGSLLYGKIQHFAPAFKVDPLDTTAAGDAFTAALSVFWDEDNLPQTLRLANATGALATTVAGAQPSLPRLESVLALSNSAPQ